MPADHPLLKDARSKIKWADKNIKDLNAAILRFRDDGGPCRIMAEREKDARLVFRVRGIREIPGSNFVLECDQVIKAIGQEKLTGVLAEFGVDTEHGYALVDHEMRTSNPRVFAGGDATKLTGEAMTVTAVQDGKLASRYIHAWLMEQPWW